MKKLIAVLVALALAAGSAFAEASWGGEVQAGVTLVRDHDEDNLMGGPRVFGDLLLSAFGSVDTGIGRFGVLAEVWQGFMDGNVWWEPAGEAFRVGAGTVLNLSGFTSGIGRQGFHRAGVPGTAIGLGGWSGGVGGAIHHDRPFLGDDGQAGISVRVLPAGDLLRVWAHAPYPTSAARAYRIFAGTEDSGGIRGSLRVDLDVGRIGFGYAARAAMPGTDIPAVVTGGDAYDELRDEHSFFGFFHTGLIANLGLDVGVRFGLNTEDDSDNHLDAGVGVNFGLNDDIDIRFRGTFGMILGDGSDWMGPQLGFEVMPSITFGDMRFSFNAGLGIDLPGSETDETAVHFIVNPYLRVNLGSPTFGVGFHLRGRNFDGETDIAWGIPIGFAFSF